MENLISPVQFLQSLERDREAYRHKRAIAEKEINERRLLILEAERAIAEIDATEKRFKSYLPNNTLTAGQTEQPALSLSPQADDSVKKPYGRIKRTVLGALCDHHPVKMTPLHIAAETGINHTQVRSALKEAKDLGHVEHNKESGPLYGITPLGAKSVGRELAQFSIVGKGTAAA